MSFPTITPVCALRAVWNASDLPKAEAAQVELVASYRDRAPKLADWLEENVPEGLASLPFPSTTAAVCAPRTR